MFRHHHQVITGVTLALALATVAPSVASARYVPEPPPATSQTQAPAAIRRPESVFTRRGESRRTRDPCPRGSSRPRTCGTRRPNREPAAAATHQGLPTQRV